MIPPFIYRRFRDKKLLIARYFASSVGRALASVLLVVLIQQFLALSHHSEGKFVRVLEAHFSMHAVPVILAVLLGGVQLFSAILAYDNRITSQRAGEILEFGVMEEVIRNLLTLSVGFFKRQSEGDLIQAIRTDIGNLTTATTAFANMVRAIVMAVALTVVAIYLSPVLAFFALFLIPVVAIPLVIFTSRRLRLISRRLRKAYPAMFDSILQMISGIRIIKAYAAEDAQAAISVRQGQSLFELLMEMVRINAKIQVILEAIGGFSLVGVIAVGGFELTKHRITWDNLVAFVFATRSLFTPLSEIQSAYSSIQTSYPSVERIRELLNERPEVVDHPDARPLPEAPGVIAFEDVSFGYGGPEGTLVLHNISFQVRAGETIGIVGPSGTGKSTLLNLITRFYDPTAGRVTFDGSDVRDFRLADVYSQTAIVTQDPFLFSASVWENIRCSRPEATDEEVEAAARGSSIHDEIMALPQGYSTMIGTNGREISRGQAQRINVARALLRNPRLLILDEATASLDSMAENEVQKSIDRLKEGRTCFIVAHRLSTLRNADRLIVLDNGRCTGIGTHSALIRDCSLYRTLWELQRLHEAEVSGLSAAPAALSS